MDIHFSLISLYKSKIQPIISNEPPIGVTGPNQLKFIFNFDLNDKIKMLKEKSIVPIIKKFEIYFFSFKGKKEIINKPSP